VSLLKYSPHLKGRGILEYGSCWISLVYSVGLKARASSILLSRIFLFVLLIGDRSREEQGWGDFARMHKNMQRGFWEYCRGRPGSLDRVWQNPLMFVVFLGRRVWLRILPYRRPEAGLWLAENKIKCVTNKPVRTLEAKSQINF